MRLVRRIYNISNRIPFLLLVGLIVILISIIGCSSDEIGVIEPYKPPKFPLPIGTIEFPSLDLNEDGEEDFVFEYIYIGLDVDPSSDLTVYLYVLPMSNNMVQYSEEHRHQPFPDSTLIDDSLGWTEWTVHLARINLFSSGWDNAWSGVWAGVSEMNLGLSIVVDNLTHYGWVKLSVDSELGTLTVHDYAYQPIPGEPILAGVHP